jgi:hypothetical protein
MLKGGVKGWQNWQCWEAWQRSEVEAMLKKKATHSVGLKPQLGHRMQGAEQGPQDLQRKLLALSVSSMGMAIPTSHGILLQEKANVQKQVL